MKVPVIVYGNSKREILFDGELELVDTVEYAIVVWPVGSKDQHFLWKDNYSLNEKIKDIESNSVYWFYWDD
jgi:hypothetical protein